LSSFKKNAQQNGPCPSKRSQELRVHYESQSPVEQRNGFSNKLRLETT